MHRRSSPVLSLLAAVLCHVLFVATSAQALSGGPIYPGGQVSTTGIYSGALIGLLQNSLGLFSLTVPRTGVGTGTAVVFKAGYFASGRITGVADPQSANLNGILDLQYAYSYLVASTSGTSSLQTITVSGAGIVTATIAGGASRFGTSAIRLSGTSQVAFTVPPTDVGTGTIQVDPLLYEPVTYTLVGFKQQEL